MGRYNAESAITALDDEMDEVWNDIEELQLKVDSLALDPRLLLAAQAVGTVSRAAWFLSNEILAIGFRTLRRVAP